VEIHQPRVCKWHTCACARRMRCVCACVLKNVMACYAADSKAARHTLPLHLTQKTLHRTWHSQQSGLAVCSVLSHYPTSHSTRHNTRSNTASSNSFDVSVEHNPQHEASKKHQHLLHTKRSSWAPLVRSDGWVVHHSQQGADVPGITKCAATATTEQKRRGTGNRHSEDPRGGTQQATPRTNIGILHCDSTTSN